MVDTSKMTKAEKQALMDQLAFELRGSGDALTPDEQTMWVLICDAVELTHKARPPLPRFLDTYGKARYRTNCAAIAEFVAGSCSEGTKRPVLMAVTVAVLAALVKHLKQRDIPHTPAVVLNSTMVLAYAVDKQYPSYAANKMLEHIAPTR